MANSDYNKRGGGSFNTVAYLAADMSEDDAQLTYGFARSNGQPINAGDALLVDDEIMSVVSVAGKVITVARGCADTVPARHYVPAVAWVIARNVGSDRKEYGAGETVTAKASPTTIGGGELPVENSKPMPVEFNWRFFRPYPPGAMMANGARWHTPAVIDDTWPSLALAWTHRDRALQADKLVGHDEPSIGPEPGTTYTMRVFNAAGDLVRTEGGLAGTSFDYGRAQALHDMGYPTATYSGTVRFAAERDGFASWQDYEIEFAVVPMAEIPSNFMPFLSAAIESPYVLNLRAGQGSGNFSMTVAARPMDRQSDRFGMLVNTAVVDGEPTSPYTPWLATRFILRELETTITIGANSRTDGVAIDSSMVGRLAMMGTEIMQITAVQPDFVTVRRGCLDSIPFTHMATTRLWIVEGFSIHDTVAYPVGTDQEYRTPPVLYGPPVDPATLPVYRAPFVGRAGMPYAPGRIVVNNRPWFEEATATSAGVAFSWARRNRITQGDTVLDHTSPDVEPEAGQVTRLQFYYQTPAAAEGEPPVNHTLRLVDVPGTSYVYPYDLALLDGEAAGLATGVCGTVVIHVFLQAVLGSTGSWQGYTIPLRVPSYPCD